MYFWHKRCLVWHKVFLLMSKMQNISCVNPQATNNVSSLEPTLNCYSDADFKNQINEYLHEGYKNHLSAEYVAGQIDDLAQKYPDMAKKYGLKSFMHIRHGVEKSFEFGNGTRPLAMLGTPDFDMFTWGARIEGDHPTKLYTKEEHQKMNEQIDKELKVASGVTAGVMVGLTAVATAPYWGPPLVAAATTGLQELTIFAATPKGQQVISDASDCISAIIPDSPPPETAKGEFCYITQQIYNYLTNKDESK